LNTKEKGMKITITIETDNRINFEKILESFRMIKGVKKVEASSIEHIPGLAYTQEERRADIREAMEEDTSQQMLHEDFMKETSTWK